MGLASSSFRFVTRPFGSSRFQASWKRDSNDNRLDLLHESSISQIKMNPMFFFILTGGHLGVKVNQRG